MKTYPYAMPEGIIELVEKTEHYAVVAELLERLRERTESHLAASARDVQTIQQQSVLLDRMASTLKSIAWIKETGLRDYSWTGETAFQALAAYESAKSGNLPDPLADAVKRMEDVPYEDMLDGDYASRGVCVGLDFIRARLIKAAREGQP